MAKTLESLAVRLEEKIAILRAEQVKTNSEVARQYLDGIIQALQAVVISIEEA